MNLRFIFNQEIEKEYETASHLQACTDQTPK